MAYPASLTPRESSCRNDNLGGSALDPDQESFSCLLDTTDKCFIAKDFPNFTPPDFIIFKVLMQNPSNAGNVAGGWVISSWY